MPVQAGPFHRQRPPGSGRKPSEQESRTIPGGRGEPPPRRTDPAPDEPRPQDRPERKRPTLVTPPAGHRHLKGRY
jgi:hypothetical protein